MPTYKSQIPASGDAVSYYVNTCIITRNTDLIRSVTAPATTGDATLVPDRALHPPL